MIDNYDSFTYNIVQYCLELGADLKVIRNDECTIKEIKALNPEKIILSPGPATPNEAGVCLDVVSELQGIYPILGICLGHQTIAQSFGAKVVRANNMMHGKTSQMNVTMPTAIFKDMPDSFISTRYHSLIVDKDSLPDSITPTAFSDDDNEIMALEVKGKNIYGVQFHPESIMSEHGYTILKNFLNL